MRDGRARVRVQAFECSSTADGVALHELHEQHPLGTQLAVAVGNPDAIPELVTILCGLHRAEIGRVDPEVRFLAQARRHIGDDIDDSDFARPFRGAFESVRQAHGDIGVAFDEGEDAGALYLDGLLLARGEGGDVDLPDRRGGEGRVVDRGKDLVDVAGQILLEYSRDLRPRSRWDLLLKRAQFCGVGLGEKVAARREELPEFYKRPAGFLAFGTEIYRLSDPFALCARAFAVLDPEGDEPIAGDDPHELGVAATPGQRLVGDLPHWCTAGTCP